MSTSSILATSCVCLHFFSSLQAALTCLSEKKVATMIYRSSSTSSCCVCEHLNFNTLWKFYFLLLCIFFKRTQWLKLARQDPWSLQGSLPFFAVVSSAQQRSKVSTVGSVHIHCIYGLCFNLSTQTRQDGGSFDSGHFSPLPPRPLIPATQGQDTLSSLFGNLRRACRWSEKPRLWTGNALKGSTRKKPGNIYQSKKWSIFHQRQDWLFINGVLWSFSS